MDFAVLKKSCEGNALPAMAYVQSRKLKSHYMITLEFRGYVFISDTEIKLPCGFTIPVGTRFTFVFRKGPNDVIYRYHVLNQNNEEV